MSSRARVHALLVAVAISGCAPPVADDRATLPVVAGIRFLAGAEAPGFARALVPRAFEFPADHGSHPGYRTEWWYFTGNLAGPAQRHFGFELALFRIALAPAPIERASQWAAQQIWMAHFALTDTAAGRFDAAERLTRGALGLAGATTAPWRVWVEDWSAQGSPAREGMVRLQADAQGVGIDLELRGFERIVAQGEGGLDRKGAGNGNASYYYSAPRLDVIGRVRTAAGDVVPVGGHAWMDREWATSALEADVEGWDWFALQLDDGRDLMFYRLRRQDGTSSPFSGGSLTDAAGATQRLGAADVELEIADEWLSPASGVRYPVGWRLRVPRAGLDLDVRPRLRDQELTLAVRYWEGAVIATDRAGGTVRGQGYVELVGY